jgi:hypothetical protein
MILEIDDTRSLRLPDDTPDETARQIKRLILATEERARAAEHNFALLHDELTALRAHVNNSTASNASHNDSIRAMCDVLAQGLQRVERAVLADRQMMADESGEYTRSRAVFRQGA